MAPTPSSKVNQAHPTQIKTPQSKLPLHYNNANKPNPSSNPNTPAKETPHPQEHPVEVITRIWDYPDWKEKPTSVLNVNSNNHSIWVRANFGYRDYSRDGLSLFEDQDHDLFYKTFEESRIHNMKLGEKCTIMMYGPTGLGKSHTMFRCSKQLGIVYRSLRDILGGGEEKS